MRVVFPTWGEESGTVRQLFVRGDGSVGLEAWGGGHRRQGFNHLRALDRLVLLKVEAFFYPFYPLKQGDETQSTKVLTQG